MNGSGTIELNAPIELVWGKLMNPDVLAECIMGCKKLEAAGNNTYHADMVVGIAAVKGHYHATIEMKDIEEPNHYTLVIHGEGGPGFIDADGRLSLTSLQGGTTNLSYEYKADVGGKVAAIGQRMLGGVAKLIIGDFFKRLKKEIEKGPVTA